MCITLTYSYLYLLLTVPPLWPFNNFVFTCLDPTGWMFHASAMSKDFVDLGEGLCMGVQRECLGSIGLWCDGTGDETWDRNNPPLSRWTWPRDVSFKPKAALLAWWLWFDQIERRLFRKMLCCWACNKTDEYSEVENFESSAKFDVLPKLGYCLFSIWFFQDVRPILPTKDPLWVWIYTRNSAKTPWFEWC